MKQIPVIYISLFLIMLGLVVTTGIISAMDRSITVNNTTFSGRGKSVVGACQG